MIMYKGVKAYRIREFNRWILFGRRLSQAGFESIHRIDTLAGVMKTIDNWVDRGLI